MNVPETRTARFLAILKWAVLAGVLVTIAITVAQLVQTEPARPTSEPWFWSVMAATVVIALLTAIVQYIRNNQADADDAILDEILEYAEDILTTLRQYAGQALRQIPEAVVRETAKDIYSAFLQGTKLAIVPEEVFVNWVLNRWRNLAKLETSTIAAMNIAMGRQPNGRTESCRWRPES